jgi:large subunit ribosomal protein L21
VVGDSFKDNKVIVYKYKPKKDYHRTIGHRQQYTVVTVESIVGA